jgi:hypothetical protein
LMPSTCCSSYCWNPPETLQSWSRPFRVSLVWFTRRGIKGLDSPQTKKWRKWCMCGTLLSRKCSFPRA